MSAVGYASASYYADSSISRAFKNSVENLDLQVRVHVRGGQAFWSTEAGTYWMGADFTEVPDTLASRPAHSALAPVDTFVTDAMTLVLLVGADCRLSTDNGRLRRVTATAPLWVESSPKDETHSYAVGLATEYFYEASSWLEAERNARRNLARSISMKVKAMQKLTAREGQEVKHEEMSVTLEHIEVVSRWRDVEKKIFYVLMRTPK